MVDLPSLTFYQAYLRCSLCIIDSHFMIITESNQSPLLFFISHWTVVLYLVLCHCLLVHLDLPWSLLDFSGQYCWQFCIERHKIYLSHGWVCSPWVHVLISDVRFSACRHWPLIFILRYIGILLCYPCFSCSNGPTISSAFFPHPIPLYMTI